MQQPYFTTLGNSGRVHLLENQLKSGFWLDLNSLLGKASGAPPGRGLIQERWFYWNCLCLIHWMCPQEEWKGLKDEALERGPFFRGAAEMRRTRSSWWNMKNVRPPPSGSWTPVRCCGLLKLETWIWTPPPSTSRGSSSWRWLTLDRVFSALATVSHACVGALDGPATFTGLQWPWLGRSVGDEDGWMEGWTEGSC